MVIQSTELAVALEIVSIADEHITSKTQFPKYGKG